MKRFDKEKELEICNLYLNGENTVIIANKFNTYNTSIRRVLIRNNISIRNREEVVRRVKNNPFINLTDENVQYWLGILMTDGNISKDGFRIILGLKDIEHLEKYVNFINSDGLKVKNYNNNRYNIKEYYVAFNNRQVHSFLNSVGITPHKSFTLNLSIDITWDMLRGIIDGDGYYRVKNNRLRSIEIVSASTLFLGNISKFLNIYSIKHSIRLSKPRLYTLGIYTYSDLLKCIYNMYNTSQIHLDRKFEKIGPTLEKSREIKES